MRHAMQCNKRLPNIYEEVKEEKHTLKKKKEKELKVRGARTQGTTAPKRSQKMETAEAGKKKEAAETALEEDVP